VATSVCLAVLALLVVQVRGTSRNASIRVGVGVEEDAEALRVYAVDADSPADRSGLRAGDRLLAIEDTPVRTLADYDRVSTVFRTGQPSRWRIERDGQSRSVAVLPGMAADWWNVVTAAAVALLCLAVGVSAWVGRSHDVRARLLAGLFWLVAVEFALPQGTSATASWFTVGAFAFYVLSGAQLALELHLAATISDARPCPASRRRLIVGVYVLGATVALAGAATYGFSLHGESPVPWTVEQFDLWMHRTVLPLWAGGLVALLLWGVARAPERRARLQAGLVLLGVLPWAVYMTAVWLQGFPGRVGPSGWERVFPLLVLCYPVAVFVAIFRYHLFDLEFVVRRSLVYTALTSVLVLVFYAALGAASAVMSRLFQGDVSPVWRFSLATLVLGLLFSPLRRATQRLIDRRFFPERAAARRRLIELAEELPSLGEPRAMGERLVRRLRDIFGTRSATLLLVEPDIQALVLHAHDGPETVGRGRVATLDDPAVARLRAAGRPLPVIDLLEVSPALGRRFRNLTPQLAVPLSVEGRLVGALLLGEKRGGIRFSREESELLRLAAHHVATVFDNARLHRTATYDRLTGLLRRESVLELLDREIERAGRYGRSLTVALADIDHFKSINDRHGHLEGDRILQHVAETLAEQVRTSDGLGRYGGEEFLLVFPETDFEGGARLAEKLRQAVAGIALRAEDGSRVAIRISIGMATLAELPGPATNPLRGLLAEADRQLYRAKAAGRNRVEPTRVAVKTPA